MGGIASFYRGKRVLLTGHTGFKGGWLTCLLKHLGAKVIGLGLAPDQSPNLFQIADVGDGVESILGDVRDGELVEGIVRELRPEIVFHLAAQPLVRDSYRDPVTTFATNVMGTVNVLEAIRGTPGVQAFVGVTSDKCYENREWEWGYRENEPMGGHDPYSSSKGCSELVIAAYRRSFFAEGNAAAIASARAGNVIGGGDWSKDRLVPDIVRSLLAKQTIVLRNPGAIRPWQHVLEPLHGYLKLAMQLCEDKSRVEGGWNFGPREEDAIDVHDLTRRAVRIWGEGHCEANADPNQPHEAGYLKLDCSKAKMRLGWRPALDVETALQWTLDWYQTVAAHPEKAAHVTYRQIERYEETLSP